MSDIYSVYIAMRDLMIRAAPAMKIGKDALGECTLNVPLDIMKAKDPVWFGSVRLTSAHVAYYLPPLAMKEGRDLAISEALKKRAQSKTCFVFHDIEAGLFAELEALTKTAAQAMA